MEFADQLIVQSLQGRIARSQQRRLMAWREESPENEQRYQEVARLWAALPEPEGEVVARRPSVAEIVARSGDRGGEPPQGHLGMGGSAGQTGDRDPVGAEARE